MLGILAGIVFGLYKGGLFAWNWYKDYKGRSSSSGQEQVVLHDPVACLAKDLSVSVREGADKAAEPVEFTVEITNIGEVPCLLDVGPRDLGVKITSGETQVSNTLSCVPKSAHDKQLLLTNGDISTTVITWDGKVQNSNCDGNGAPSKPGTYHGEVVTPNGVLGEEHITFVLK